MFITAIAVSKSLLLGAPAALPAGPAHGFRAYDCFAFAVSYSDQRRRGRDRAMVSPVVRVPAGRSGSCHRAEALVGAHFATAVRHDRRARGVRYSRPVVYSFSSPRRAELERRDLVRHLERSRWRVRTARLDSRLLAPKLPGRVNPYGRVRVVRRTP